METGLIRFWLRKTVCSERSEYTFMLRTQVFLEQNDGAVVAAIESADFFKICFAVYLFSPELPSVFASAKDARQFNLYFTDRLYLPSQLSSGPDIGRLTILSLRSRVLPSGIKVRFPYRYHYKPGLPNL